MKQQLPLGLLLVMLSSGIQANAQSPGGVTPAAWYHAGTGVYSDLGATPAGDNVTVRQWSGSTPAGSFPLLQNNAALRPVFSNASVLTNFNPTVSFDGANDVLQFTAGAGVNVINRATGTMFAAGFMDKQKGSGFAGFHGSMDYPGLHFFTNYKLLFFTAGGPGYQGLSDSAMKPKSFFTAGTGWQNGTTFAQATVSLNGFRKSYLGSEIYNVQATNDLARDFRIGADNNWGAFSGQLNEVLVFEDRLTEAQMDQVESYLAIKYGTTYANGTKDYKSATGTTVWSASTNNGYHSNIAGIANDGALQQKQSWSTNPGQQLLIGTTGLSNTNAANGTGLASGKYLIWGDNGLSKTPNVAISGITGISHRFASIWKVQENGAGVVRVAWVKNLSNLSLIQSTDNIFNSSDLITSMAANETTINGVVYNYADVTLANGQYLTLAAKVAAPGGVSGPAVWLKADAGTTLAGSSVSGWVNYGNSGGIAGQLGRTNTLNWALPKYGANEHNFNPAIIDDVPATNDGSMLLADVFPAPGHRALSSFILHSRDNVSSSENNMIAFTPLKITTGALEAPYMAGYRGNRPWFYWQGPYENAPTLPNSVTRINNIPSVNGFYVPQWVSGTPHQTTVSMNGAIATTPAYNTNATSYPFGNQLFIFGDGNANNWSGGKISEVITYDKLLTDTEKQQVNSYLAIKYGITLNNNGGTAVPNYLSSTAAVVWDATANAGYNKNIAGIANDLESTLNQKQSKSVNTGQQVLIGSTGLANTNAANTSSLSNNQYLIWGDNGGSKSLSKSYVSAFPQLNLRFESVWKVQNSNFVGAVRVTWPTGVPGIHLLTSSAPDFSSGVSSYDMTGNTTTINGVAYNYVDVSLANGIYFTFGGYVIGPGGVASAAWYRADGAGQLFSDAGTTVSTEGAVVHQWNEYKGTGHNFLQYGGQTRPTFSDAKILANFNPTVTFENNARLYYDPGVGNSIIDRANGTLFAAGKIKTLSNSGFWGFNETNDDPGLHVFGAQNKLLFYTRSGSAFTGYSSNSFQANSYFTAGGSWQNGATNLSAATSSLNGMRTEYGPSDNILNVLSADANARDMMMGRDGNTGAINGQLNELVVFEDRLSVDDMDRVETYLAIKYGTTFAEGTRNYKNSSLGTIWTAASNNGYHYNIAGIARDDQGSLYQKQSWSTNQGKQVLISTTGLANTNIGNTAVLGNNQFLVWGDNNLSKSPSEPFATIGGLPYQRFAAIWKAENTNDVGIVRVAWPKGLANLKLIVSDDAIFTTSDDIHEMDGTQVVNGVEYAYTDVPLTNIKPYFTFAAFLQAPGGVTAGILMWHKADDGIVDAGAKNEWQDVSGNGRDVYQPNNANYEPTLQTAATYSGNFFNFNPSYSFDGGDYFFRDEIYFPSPTSAGSAYGVAQGSGTHFGWGDDDPNLVKGANSFEIWRDNGGTVSGSVPTYGNGVAQIGGMAWRGATNGIYLNANGRTYTSTTQNIGTIQSGGSNYEFAIGSEGFDVNNNGNERFTGGIPEVFAYSVDHQNSTGNEKARINSYLAIKYGITLSNDDGTAAASYLSSASDTVWNAINNTGYNNHIAGLANDFASALHQKQSRSVNSNSNSQVTIGLGDIAATNAENSSNLNDGQFLLWGDNGLTNTLAQTAGRTPFNYGGATTSQRMTRVWKAQNTNVGQEVVIRFPKASVADYDLGAGTCQRLVLIVANNPTFDNAIVRPLTETDDALNWDATYTFANGYSYFTYAKITPYSEGLVYLPAVTETTPEYNSCGVGEWIYFNKQGAAQQNLFAAAGFSNSQLDEFEVTVTPEGAAFSDGSLETRLMPRITTVNDDGSSYTGSKKVRIYYDVAEMNSTILPSPLTNGWFKYEGNAVDVITDIYTDGVFLADKAIAITPAASGIEDGVHFVEFHNITSFSSFVFLSSTEPVDAIVLPVTLLHFAAEIKGSDVLVSWSTVSERNNKGFEVQHSDNGNDWTSLAFVNSRADRGNSSELLTYSYVDKEPVNGKNFYRLKQIDFDGRFEYSPVTVITFSKDADVRIYPNPASSVLTIEGVAQGDMVRIFNTLGQEQVAQTVIANEKQVRLDVANLVDGVYYITLSAKDGKLIIRQKFVKQ